MSKTSSQVISTEQLVWLMDVGREKHVYIPWTLLNEVMSLKLINNIILRALKILNSGILAN